MLRILTIILSLFVAVHGLIHLLGFVAYWPLREVSELPYKTSLLSGKLEAGAAGMRLLACSGCWRRSVSLSLLSVYSSPGPGGRH